MIGTLRGAQQERSKPLMDARRAAMDQILPSPVTQISHAKVLLCTRKRWTALPRLLEDGRAEIGHSVAGRAMRNVAIDQKNWFFAGSKAAGERAIPSYSIVMTCKLNSIEPQSHISDVTDEIASGWPTSRRDEPMPWNWTSQNQAVQAT